MRVLEQFCLGKSGRGEGDDRIFVSGEFAAVVDGETDKGSTAGAGRGSAVAACIAEAIGTLEPDASARAAIDHISLCVRELGTDDERRPGASVVAYSAARREIWRVGDCQYAIDGRSSPSVKALDVAAANVRAAHLAALLRAGASVDALLADDPGRDLILPLLLSSSAFRNAEPPCEWAFGTIDGSTVPDALLECVAVPPDASTITLASDGYPVLAETLERSEWALSAALAADPLCIAELRSTKGLQPGNVSFDDRAWIRLEP